MGHLARTNAPTPTLFETGPRTLTAAHGHGLQNIGSTTRTQSPGHWQYHTDTEPGTLAVPHGHRARDIGSTTRTQSPGHWQYHTDTEPGTLAAQGLRTMRGPHEQGGGTFTASDDDHVLYAVT
jgi:hypothetical protein